MKDDRAVLNTCARAMKLCENSCGVVSSILDQRPCQAMSYDRVIRFAAYELRPAARTLRSAQGRVELRPKSFDVLRFLAENAGHVMPRALNETRQSVIKAIPGKGYVLAAQTTVIEGGTEPAGPASVAVLTFEDMSARQDQAYFADGLGEEITSALARFSNLAVIARNLAFHFKGKSADVREIGRQLGARFLVEGSVRRDASSIRITAQLIEAASRKHLWSESFERDRSGVLALQEQIARTIAGLTGAHVAKLEEQRAVLRPALSGTAYDHYLRGLGLARSWYAGYRDIGFLYEARAEFEQAILLEPRVAQFHAGLASTYFSTYLFQHDGDYRNQAVLERIKALALKAIEFDPNLQDAYWNLGHALYHSGHLEQALAAHEKAFALNPSRADFRYAVALIFAGEHQKAIEVSHFTYAARPPSTHPLPRAGSVPPISWRSTTMRRSAHFWRRRLVHPDGAAGICTSPRLT